MTEAKHDSISTPRLEYVDASKTCVDEITALLIHNGGVVVRGFVDLQVLEQINRDLVPRFPELSSNSYIEGDTKTLSGLAGLSSAYLDGILLNPLYYRTCKQLLSSTFIYKYGGTPLTQVINPQLNAATAFLTPPKNIPQSLHRDDVMHHNIVPAISAVEYKAGRDAEVNVFTAGSRSVKENGATRFIPGSHLWGSDEVVDQSMDERLSVYAELQPGDAFFMLGSTYHAASANTTENENRLMYSTALTKGYLKTVENHFLTYNMDYVRKLPSEAQMILGYRGNGGFLGYIDLKKPEDYLKLDEIKG